ncbi:hypothetical protein HAX54_049327, partial [Datura stramonium]|nr:hypothetical protein [Datura stramonium]
ALAALKLARRVAVMAHSALHCTGLAQAENALGIDVTKTKDPKGIHGPVLSISECNARFDNMLSHLYEPLDDDDSTEEKQAKVDFDLESDDDEDDFKMGETIVVPKHDED